MVESRLVGQIVRREQVFAGEDELAGSEYQSLLAIALATVSKVLTVFAV